MRKGFWKATIIGIILCLLIIWALPSFDQFRCRAKQSEARMGLSQLANAELFYRQDHRKYASLESLAAASLASFRKKYYRFSVYYLGEKSFELRATGIPQSQVNGDTWSIDEKGTLKHLTNACLSAS